LPKCRPSWDGDNSTESHAGKERTNASIHIYQSTWHANQEGHGDFLLQEFCMLSDLNISLVHSISSVICPEPLLRSRSNFRNSLLLVVMASSEAHCRECKVTV
jgi:hypothetical protein